MSTQLFKPWFQEYAKQAALQNERRLVILSGSDSWALSLVSSVDIFSAYLKETTSSTITTKKCLIFGDSVLFPANVDKKRYRDKLGSESEMIIFADSEFTVDAFAALSGTLKAGGILFLVVPSIKERCQESHFFKRFYSLIEAMPKHVIISENQPELLQLKLPLSIQLNQQSTKHKISKVKQLYPFDCITAEQHSAVQAIEKVVTGHRKRPLVLTADRGRGKSSALAIACAQLMLSNSDTDFKIFITAPDSQALEIFFRQLKQSLPLAEHKLSRSTLGKASLTFMPIDELLKQQVKANLVLVDEAAAIPVYLLEQLLCTFHRMVFSSTVHGYEGAGRGFTIKFKKSLDSLCPQWQSLHIKQTIRWRQGDPLEQLVFDACLLNAELPILTSIQKERLELVAKSVFKVITASDFIANEALLQQVFSVLVTAHYQTKPSDLKLLLDNPHVQVACLFSSPTSSSISSKTSFNTSINKDQPSVIAVSLLMNEGGSNYIEEADILAVKNSQRRLRNQFLPQSLLSHCGFEPAFDYRYLRIMRIAVHPELQQQGIGSHLLGKIQWLAAEQGADFVGTSFGINHELMSFWLKADFTTVRIGFTKDKASGEHSALLIKGIKNKAEQLQQQFQREFYRSFDYLLLEEYRTLTTELVRLLLIQQPREGLVALSALDMANVQAFTQGERLYSSCAFSLYLWLKHDLLSCNKNSSKELEHDSSILIARLIQKQTSEKVCQQYGLTGKKMLNLTLKNAISLRIKKDSHQVK